MRFAERPAGNVERKAVLVLRRQRPRGFDRFAEHLVEAEGLQMQLHPARFDL